MLNRRQYSAAEPQLRQAFDLASTHGFELFRQYALASLARLHLDQARFDEANVRAAEVLRARRASTAPRIVALGPRDPVPADLPWPHALQLRGAATDAAAAWKRVGCPYEAALALADEDETELLHEAFLELQRLGADAAGRRIARRLRKRGATSLPRGPRPSTRQNPFGLTRRELEVVMLIGDGLRNVEIAERLFISIKTVDHHSRRPATRASLRVGRAPSRESAGKFQD